MSDEDSGSTTPKIVMVSDDFNWKGDATPATPLNETVIYEMHVKGLTWLRPAIDDSTRGTANPNGYC